MRASDLRAAQEQGESATGPDMLYLLLADWRALELPNASQVKEEVLYLVCCDDGGREIARYERLGIVAYGTSQSLKEYFESQGEATKEPDSL